jgi:N-methylhydantoinase B
MILDPVTLEVLGNKVVAAAEEMCVTLQRLGRTLYVKETSDFCCALAGLDGQFFAYPKAIGVSGFVGLDCRPVIEAVGSLAPGDVILTNDPYRSFGLATHLPDLHLIAPYFHGDRIVAYGWAFVHSSDVGGRVPSSILPSNTEIFQEGLQVPPVKLVRSGAINADLELLLRANSRTPDANMGDIRAMLAALERGGRRVAAIVAQHGTERFLAAQQDLLDYAERKAIAVLASLPEGRWQFADYLDSDAVSDRPVRLAATVTLRGGTVHIDFTGSDPQVATALNIPSAGRVHPWLTLRLMSLVATLDPTVPLNAGLKRPIRVTAPAGTVVHSIRPAAVGVRHAASVRVNDVLTGALGLAVPDVMTAANGGMIVPVVVAEPDGRGGLNVQVVEPLTGGSGARRGCDGVDGRDPSISNLANNPVETVEAELGIEVERYAIRIDSGGAGEWRGGHGLVLAFRVGTDGTILLARGMERAMFRPWGSQGGQAGEPARLVIERAGRPAEVRHRIDVVELVANDRVTLFTAGAGGWGPPLQRDPARVLEDVRRGLLSPEAALSDYSVVITEDEVDEAATAARRAAVPRDPAAGMGPERNRWDKVFRPETLDRLVAALASLPIALRQRARTTLYDEVLAALPAGFPLQSADEAAMAVARKRLVAAIETLERRSAAIGCSACAQLK